MRWVAEARRQRLETAEVGSLIEGKVVKHLECGMLVDIGDGACGLAHHSEMIRNVTPSVGDTIPVVVVGTDPARGRVALSHRKGARRLFGSTRTVGEEFDGKVIAIKQYGAFVELEPGIAGLVHSSRLSREVTLREGDSLRVKVMRFDDTGERIDLAVVHS